MTSLASPSRAGWVAVALAVAGCGDRAAGSDAWALDQLERLAFVSVSESILPVETAGAPRFRAFAVREPLLVDRFEVTRADWLAWLEGGGAPSAVRARTGADAWRPEESTWPATFMTLGEARAYAEARGMRLPTAEEWICVAVGTREREFPWGSRWQDSVANTLELGLGRPCAVGTFRSGQTPGGVADLLGNVWEWVADRLPGVEPAPGDPQVTVMGGSYTSWTRNRRVYREGRFLAEPLHPESRASDVGFRCVAPARAWLDRNAGALLGAPDAEERLRAVGRRWGSASAPWLEEWSAGSPDPRALRLLLAGAEE